MQKYHIRLKVLSFHFAKLNKNLSEGKKKYLHSLIHIRQISRTERDTQAF